MTKKEYIDLLRYYFTNADKKDVDEIIADYEEHFAAGYEEGLTDEDIIKALGAPETIYAEYISEGIVTEKKGRLKGDLYTMMQRAQQGFKNNIQPQLPHILENTSKIVMLTSSAVAYLCTILCWFTTPIVLYLLSINWQPFVNIAPIPSISPVTMTALGATGFFAGLTCLFIGNLCRKMYKIYGDIAINKGAN